MTRNVLAIALLAAAAVSATDRPSTVDTRAAFARLKSLAGEWQADTPMGKARLTYELVGAGTTLMERESAEKMPTMMTAYHLDGSRLLLTHYCAAGNQPRMQAERYDASTGELRFRFLDATNLASPAAGHMHNMTLRFEDADQLTAEWEFYEAGRPKRTESFHYARVK